MFPDFGDFIEMNELARRFFRSSEGSTAIEYALMASGVALVIVTALSQVGTNLSSAFNGIASAFPSTGG